MRSKPPHPLHSKLRESPAFREALEIPGPGVTGQGRGTGRGTGRALGSQPLAGAGCWRAGPGHAGLPQAPAACGAVGLCPRGTRLQDRRGTGFIQAPQFAVVGLGKPGTGLTTGKLRQGPPWEPVGGAPRPCTAPLPHGGTTLWPLPALLTPPTPSAPQWQPGPGHRAPGAAGTQYLCLHVPHVRKSLLLPLKIGLEGQGRDRRKPVSPRPGGSGAPGAIASPTPRARSHPSLWAQGPCPPPVSISRCTGPDHGTPPASAVGARSTSKVVCVGPA